MFSQRRLLLALLLSVWLHLLVAVSFDVVWGKLSFLPGLSQPLQVSLETHRDAPTERLPAMPAPAPAPASAQDTPLSLEEPPPSESVPDLARKYYTLKELDVPPEPLAPIEPVPPGNVPPDIHGGVVRLQLLLDEQGRVEQVTVLSSSPQGYFEQAAIEAFREAAFTPGIRFGSPVPSEIRLYVRFGAQ